MDRLVQIEAKVNLSELLNSLLPEAASLSWAVLDLGEVIPGDGSDESTPFRERRVDSEPGGWCLGFDELIEYADWIRQIVDGVIVGCASNDLLPVRAQSDEEILTQTELVVASVDSSFWIVGGPDAVVSRVLNKFGGSNIPASSGVVLSTWGRDY
jgi:hypothetical protein